MKNGYVYLFRPGAAPTPAFAGFGGAGLVPELAGLLYTGTASGVAFHLYHVQSGSLDAIVWFQDFFKETFTGDSSIRKWVFANSSEAISAVEPAMKASMVNRLLDGWISDDDLKALAAIYRSIKEEYERDFVKKAIARRLNDISDFAQRTKVRLLIEG